MPGISNLKLGRRIRNRLPSLRIVLTSGYSQVLADDAHHGFLVVHEPYSVGELGRIRHSARKTKGITNARVKTPLFQSMD